MAKDCWCDLTFHLPGEKKRHQRAWAKARELMKIINDVEKKK